MNLDKVMEDVLHWQSVLISVSTKKNELSEENKSLKALLDNQKKTEDNVKQQNDALRQTVKTLQETLLQNHDYKGECRKLESQLSATKKNRNQNEADLNDQLELLRKEHENLKQEHALRIDILLDEHKTKQKNQWEELQQKNSALRNEAEIEKAKHLENLKTQEHARGQLRKEYEGKIVLLQAQIQAKAQNTTHNDIFRKKLQHIRETSSKEIASLRAEIAELENILAKQTRPDSFLAGYSRHVVNTSTKSGSIFRRKRAHQE